MLEDNKQSGSAKRRRFLASVALAASGGVAGCAGGGGSQEDEPEPTTSQQTAATETTAQTPSQTRATIGIANGGWDLIPARDTDFDSNKVYTLIYDNLVSLNSDAEIVPELATDWTRESDTQYVFNLREGVEFHNGTSFTADDVRYTFEWIRTKENPRKNYIAPVEDVVVEGDHTVRFDLTSPYGPLLNKIYAVMWPLSKEAIDEYGSDYNTNPVGTGPYKLTSWQSGESAVLEKFDKYWKDDLPHIDEIEFRILPEASTKIVQLTTGAVDLVDRAPPQKANQIEESEDIDLITTDGVSVGRVDFNTDVEPLGNRKVRRALAWAVNKPQIVNTVLRGFGKPATSVVPSSFPTYNGDLSDFNHPTGDPEKARQLLEEAGHTDLSLEFLVPTRQRHEQQATLLQSMFGNIGVDVSIQTMAGNAFWSTELEGNFDVAISNFTWFGDADTLVYLFHSKGLNLWNINNQNLNSLLEEQRRTVDPQQRQQLLNEIQRIIYEEAYSVFTYYPKRIQGISKKISGFKQFPNGSFQSLDEASF